MLARSAQERLADDEQGAQQGRQRCGRLSGQLDPGAAGPPAATVFRWDVEAEELLGSQGFDQACGLLYGPLLQDLVR